MQTTHVWCTHLYSYIARYMMNSYITLIDIREEIGKRHCRNKFDELATRKHFITRQDCRNVCRKVKDFTNWHENDAVSVNRIVEELQLEDVCPVIAYKALGVKIDSCPLLKEENFLLAIMTEFQAVLFKKFSSLLCVDSTHKTNEYGYKLITVLVVDEFHNGMQLMLYDYSYLAIYSYIYNLSSHAQIN